VLDTQRQKHTVRICNTYCSSTAAVVTRTRLNVTVIRKLSGFLLIDSGLKRTVKVNTYIQFYEFHLFSFCSYPSSGPLLSDTGIRERYHGYKHRNHKKSLTFTHYNCALVILESLALFGYIGTAFCCRNEQLRCSGE
jgi:hypothetical protein